MTARKKWVVAFATFLIALAGIMIGKSRSEGYRAPSLQLTPQGIKVLMLSTIPAIERERAEVLARAELHLQRGTGLEFVADLLERTSEHISGEGKVALEEAIGRIRNRAHAEYTEAGKFADLAHSLRLKHEYLLRHLHDIAASFGGMRNMIRELFGELTEAKLKPPPGNWRRHFLFVLYRMSEPEIVVAHAPIAPE